MLHGVQIASLTIILTIIISYFQYKRISLMSTKMFTGFLFLALFNIIMEFVTLYTIDNIDAVGSGLNRLSHQLFIGSLDAMILFMYLYVDIKSRKQQRYSLTQLFIRCIPAIGAFLMVVFGELRYHTGPDGSYSYGPMAMSVYASVGIYIVMIIIRLRRSKESFSKKEKFNLHSGVCIWIVIACIQLLNPEFLMSSLGIGLMVAFVYISFENPREYQERDLPEVMNRFALELALSEQLQKGKTFYVVSMILTNGDLLRNTHNYEEFSNMLQAQSEKALGSKNNRFCFNEYMISTVFSKKDEYRLWRSQCERHIENPDGEMNSLKLQFVVLECPKYAKNVKEAFELLKFSSDESGKYIQGDLVEVDEACVEQVGYYRAVEGLLQKALNEDGLQVYYQPIYSTKKKMFSSAEALVRLKDCGAFGFVSPEIFIPMAEKTGVIGTLGNIVFEKVCKLASEEGLNQYGIDYIEVNLSGIQSIDEKLPAELSEITDKYHINPDFINLEITETAAVKAGKKLFDNMSRLRQAGYNFSMDDFGTGYSNLSQIAEVNFDLIKLDKSLIWPCFEAGGEKAQVILDACINMIHHLGCGIVAEGVETEEQAEYLIKRKVEYLQGYYFSKPVPQEEYIKFVKEHNGTSI